MEFDFIYIIFFTFLVHVKFSDSPPAIPSPCFSMLFRRLKAMATSMKDLVGDPLDDFAKKFTEEFIALGIRRGGAVPVSWVAQELSLSWKLQDSHG